MMLQTNIGAQMQKYLFCSALHSVLKEIKILQVLLIRRAETDGGVAETSYNLLGIYHLL